MADPDWGVLEVRHKNTVDLSHSSVKPHLLLHVLGRDNLLTVRELCHVFCPLFSGQLRSVTYFQKDPDEKLLLLC